MSFGFREIPSRLLSDEESPAFSPKSSGPTI